jgi:hypothetical protein
MQLAEVRHSKHLRVSGLAKLLLFSVSQLSPAERLAGGGLPGRGVGLGEASDTGQPAREIAAVKPVIVAEIQACYRV